MIALCVSIFSDLLSVRHGSVRAVIGYDYLCHVSLPVCRHNSGSRYASLGAYLICNAQLIFAKYH